MFPTLKDIAERAGVHPSTVSRVLRGKENLPISDETRQRILSVAKELNYQPDQLARAFRLGKTHTIGLLIPDIANPFFSRIARSIEIASYKADYNLVVCNTDEEQEKENHFVNTLLRRGVDGLIIAPVQDADAHIKDLCERHFPLVLIDRCFDDIDTNAVISDNETAAYNAISYLAKANHRRIGFVSGRQNIYTIRKRLVGYKRAILDFDLDDDPSLMSGYGYNVESGYHATLKLLSMQNPPTALMISGNLISVGTMKAISEKHLSIPEDISVVGFTDFISVPYWSAPLTTVTHPIEEMGVKAFDILFRRMESSEPLANEKVVIKTQFEIRQSVRNL